MQWQQNYDYFIRTNMFSQQLLKNYILLMDQYIY